jgi:hypothetical protein
MPKLAEQGCTSAYWPDVPFSDKFACFSPDFLLQTLDAHPDKAKVNCVQ